MNRKEAVVATLDNMDNLTEVQKLLCNGFKRDCTYCPMYVSSGIGENTCAIIRTIEFFRSNL